MTRALPRNLLAPLVYVIALVLLIEQWCWDAGKRLGARFGAYVARWPGITACEERVRALPPRWALCAFALPSVLLLPVKLLGLLAIAHGHAASGLATIVVAKLGGTVVVARIYTLTLPTLLALAWFARCHGWFMELKERFLVRLRAHALHRWSVGALRTVRRLVRRIVRRRRAGAASGWRGNNRALRVLRRFASQWRSARSRERHSSTRDLS